jgi:hypothetical protein
MSESLRGSRLGSTSYEVDKGARPDVSMTEYICPSGHVTALPFSSEADEIPDTWECECGQLGVRDGVTLAPVTPLKRPRSHWDMILERRSRDELQDLLNERLEVLRGGRRSA